MTQLRNDLIVITSRIPDEPAAAFEQLETYIKNLIIKAKVETYEAIMEKIKSIEIGKAIQRVNSESRAYSLYCAGKHGTQIAETLGDEYPELDYDQIASIILAAFERFTEKSIPLENKELRKD